MVIVTDGDSLPHHGHDLPMESAVLHAIHPSVALHHILSLLDRTISSLGNCASFDRMSLLAALELRQRAHCFQSEHGMWGNSAMFNALSLKKV